MHEGSRCQQRGFLSPCCNPDRVVATTHRKKENRPTSIFRSISPTTPLLLFLLLLANVNKENVVVVVAAVYPFLLLPPSGGTTSATVDTSGRGASSFSSFLISFQAKGTNLRESITGGIDGTRYSGRGQNTDSPSSWIFLGPGSGGHCLFLRGKKIGKIFHHANSRQIPAPRALFTALSAIATCPGRLT